MTDEQIVQAFVRDYGMAIYLAPPSAFGWIVPYASIGLGPGGDHAVPTQVPQAESRMTELGHHRDRRSGTGEVQRADRERYWRTWIEGLKRPVIIAITCVIAIVVIVFILGVRPKDLPDPNRSPRSLIWTSGRRRSTRTCATSSSNTALGKLSDEDYQQTKKDLQKELAAVLAEVDRVKLQLQGGRAATAAAAAPAPKPSGTRRTGFADLPALRREFEQALKFCGECGKPMKAVRA